MIPKKLNPDKIKDALVEIQFSSQHPYELLLGLLFTSLDNSYSYANRSRAKRVALFYNDQIRFEVGNGYIIFNCLEKYPGWEIYLNEISKTLIQLNKENKLGAFHTVGLRYINEFPGEGIDNVARFNYSIGKLDVKPESYGFRLNYLDEEDKILLILENRNKYQKAEGSPQKYAYVDIGIVRHDLKIVEVNKLIEVLNVLHEKEKEIFIEIIDEDFLKSLNPEY